MKYMSPYENVHVDRISVGRPKPPKIFGSSCDEKLEFSLVKRHFKLS